MKFIFGFFLLFFSSPLFSQFHHTDDIKEKIHLRMLRFYGYSGTWTVTVKEWSKGRDTIFFYGMTEGHIRINEDIKKDSSNLTFDFEWVSQFDREMIDLSKIDIVYNWDNDTYGVILHHLPKNGTWIASFYSTKAEEVTESMRFYPEEPRKKRHPVPFSEWKFQDNKISLILHQRRIDETIRMRIFEFVRGKNP